jgi:hypothetical protein
MTSVPLEPSARWIMFPYAIVNHKDGSWTFLNRAYNVLGAMEDHSDYHDPKHRIYLKGLTPAVLAKVDVHGRGTDETTYLYHDGCIPGTSAANTNAYLKRLAPLLTLKGASPKEPRRR